MDANGVDYDDPAVEEQWCSEQREHVIEYLERENLTHGDVGEWPAWHLAPYVAIWAIESVANPGWVGWWAISGDLPTDYISAGSIRHPRQAMAEFARQWEELSQYMQRGEPHPDRSIGTPEHWPELAPLLSARARLLSKFAKDDELWEE